jgi:5'(3')-deoxyribonucleotidase
MKTIELKKGDKVLLTCGFMAEIMDNKRGNIRLANIYTDRGEEMCKVFVWDINAFVEEKNGDLLFKTIDLTPAEKKVKEISIKTFSFIYPKS